MSGDVDERLCERLRDDLPAFVPDWPAVERRARGIRRTRVARRAALVAAATLAVALVVSPAGARLGEALGILEPAPASLVEQLQGMDEGWPDDAARRPIGARPEETRRVLSVPTAKGDVVLRVTPAASGSCASLGYRPAGGKERSATIQCGMVSDGVDGVTAPGGMFDIAFGGVMFGQVTPAATAVELEWANGGRTSAPVANGWYLAALDASAVILPGADTPTAVVARGADGRELARAPIPKAPIGVEHPNRPPAADLTGERRVVQVPAGPDGAVAELFLSPTRRGPAGWCGRARAGDVHLGWTCSTLPTYGHRLWFALAPVGAGRVDALVVHGVVRRGLGVELRFEDGAAERVTTHHGLYVTAVGADRLQPGRRLRSVAALNADGRTVDEIAVATGSTRLYDAPVIPSTVQAAIAEPAGEPDEVVALRTAAGGLVEWRIWRPQDAKWSTATLRYRGKVVGSEQTGPALSGSPRVAIGLEYLPILSEDGADDASLLRGGVDERAAALRIRYADGSTEPIALTGRRFLFEITPARLARRPVRLEALDAAGRLVGRERLVRDAM